MHTLSKLIFPIILLYLMGCKKEKDPIKEDNDYVPEPFSYVIPIDDEHDDLYTAAAYKGGRILVTGHTVLEVGVTRSFLVLVDSKGNVVLNRQYPDIPDLFSPAFTQDRGYVCLSRGTAETEVLVFHSNGEIISRFNPIDEVFPILGFSSSLDSSVIKKVIVAGDGSFLITGEINAGRQQQAFVAKTDDIGNIHDIQKLREHSVNDLAELSNGPFAWLAKGHGEEVTSLILLNDSLTFPANFWGTKHGSIYARTDLPGLYTAGFEGFDKWSNEGAQKYSMSPPYYMYNASVTNDGGLILLGGNQSLIKCYPDDGSMEWLTYLPTGYARFIHQLPDDMYLGISQKNSLGINGDIDLYVFRMEGL